MSDWFFCDICGAPLPAGAHPNCPDCQHMLDDMAETMEEYAVILEELNDAQDMLAS